MSDQPTSDAASATPNAATSVVGLAELRIQPSMVSAGIAPPPLGTVSLISPAPPGGVEVELASDRPDIAAVPPVLRVPEGATAAFFQLSVTPTQVATQAVITATLADVSRSATLTSVASPSAVALAALREN